MCGELGIVPCYWNTIFANGLSRYHDWFWSLPTGEDSNIPVLKYKFSALMRKTDGNHLFRHSIASKLLEYPHNTFRMTYGIDTPVKVNPVGAEDNASTADKTNDVATGYFHNVFCPIICESRFDNIVTLSEKTVRPLVHRRPFIMVGAPYSLKMLRGYGFETFGKWFDESYDEITNHADRMTAILSLMDEISKMPMSSLEKILKDMAPALKHNLNHAYTTAKVELKGEMIGEFKEAILPWKTTAPNGWMMERIQGTDDAQIFFKSVCNHPIQEVMTAAASGDHTKMDELIGYHLTKTFGLSVSTKAAIMSAIQNVLS